MLKNVKAKRENLERAIADAGITNVKQLADMAGIDRRSVGNAAGGKPVRWATAVAIVRALNTAMSGDGEALTVYELFEAGEPNG